MKKLLTIKLLEEKSYIFKSRILEFEKVLVDYYIKIADLDTESKKVAYIFEIRGLNKQN